MNVGRFMKTRIQGSKGGAWRRRRLEGRNDGNGHRSKKSNGKTRKKRWRANKGKDGEKRNAKEV